MSPPSVLPPLLLLFAVASAGPLDLPDEGTPAPASTFLPPSLAAAAAAANAATSTAAPHAAHAAPEERAIPAATIAPSSDGQYCTVAGVVFHNGARLPASADPDPCRACYCQAGESVCTRVHCYRRPDCAPRHVPGSCCPKYDSCPPVQEDRSPEPRVRDAATQTDASAEPTAATSPATPTTAPAETTEANSAKSTVTAVTAASTTTQEATEATEMTASTTAATVTDSTSALPTTTVTAIGSTTDTSSAELAMTSTSTSTEDDGEESAESAATSAYPPGIDLYALHEHLPFLSPGDANGPST